MTTAMYAFALDKNPKRTMTTTTITKSKSKCLWRKGRVTMTRVRTSTNISMLIKRLFICTKRAL